MRPSTRIAVSNIAVSQPVGAPRQGKHHITYTFYLPEEAQADQTGEQRQRLRLIQLCLCFHPSYLSQGNDGRGGKMKRPLLFCVF